MDDHYWLNSMMQALDFVLDLDIDEHDRERLRTAHILIGQKLDGTVTKGTAEAWGKAGLTANEERFSK